MKRNAMLPRYSKILLLLLSFAAFSLGCASGPSVISSTPEKISIEFPNDGTVADASKLAEQGCQGYGKIADFDSVQPTASPKTRVAIFNCVSNAKDTKKESSDSESTQ